MARNKSTFHFKSFCVKHENASMKVGTDGVLLGAWAAKSFAPKNILDIGTGSGLIALMMAQRFPDAKITGIDIDAPSIEDAAYNALHFPLKNQLQIIQSDFMDYRTNEPVDLIISNPPYFSDALLSQKDDKNRVRHQIHLTMENLIKHSAEMLESNGRIALILPVKEMLASIEMAVTYLFFPKKICYISSTQEQSAIRMMVEFSREKTLSPQEERLIIYESDRTYTDDYKKLTKDFYLNF